MLSAFLVFVSSEVLSLNCDCALSAYLSFCSRSAILFVVSSIFSLLSFDTRPNSANASFAEPSFTLRFNSLTASPTLSTLKAPLLAPSTRVLINWSADKPNEAY